MVVESLQSLGALEDLRMLGAGILAPTFQWFPWEGICHGDEVDVITDVLFRHASIYVSLPLPNVREEMAVCHASFG